MYWNIRPVRQTSEHSTNPTCSAALASSLVILACGRALVTRAPTSWSPLNFMSSVYTASPVTWRGGGKGGARCRGGNVGVPV